MLKRTSSFLLIVHCSSKFSVYADASKIDRTPCSTVLMAHHSFISGSLIHVLLERRCSRDGFSVILV